MHRLVQLSLLILAWLFVSCEKSSSVSDSRAIEGDSKKTMGESQGLKDVTFDDVMKSPEKLAYYETGAIASEETQRILKNDGLFRKELTTKDGKYLIQLGVFESASGPENIAVLSKETGGKFVPTMVVPIRVKSVPSLYEETDKLYINFKQETDWGAEITIEDDGIKFKDFEE